MEPLLQQIKAFADNAHGEQMRRYTAERYIVHPVRVMERCREYTTDLTMLAAALLHDVLEDTPVTKAAMKNFLAGIMGEGQARKTVQLVEELTDVYTKAGYPYWNRRKRKRKEAERVANTSAAAQTIKYADIMDNAPEITAHDADFAQTYLYECSELLKRMQKGNPELHDQAVEAVNQCMAGLKVRH